MLNVLRQSSRWTLLLCLSSGLVSTPAIAQASGQLTPLNRQLQRLDLSINGVGQFTKSVSGTNYQGSPTETGVAMTQQASNTLGALLTIRYTKSPLLGAEFNYSYARYDENYLSTPSYIGKVQTRANEYTVGYVAHGPSLLGFHTFGSGGVGSLAFTPTPYGGQGLPERARLAFYYAVGIEEPIFTRHIGIRAQFRQVFYKAPDFDQNYLTLNKRTFTTEPGVGIYLHF